MTDDEVTKVVHDLGFEPDAPGYRWWVRLKCRLFGPHDWVPLMGYDMDTEKLTMDGVICHRCQKET